MKLPTFHSFEVLSLQFKNQTEFLLVSIYRPPGNPIAFLTEFQNLLEILTLLTCEVILVGDFNLHVDEPHAAGVSDFQSILKQYN